MNLKRVLMAAALAVATAFLFQVQALRAEDAPAKEKDDATIIKEQLPTYPLKNCIIETNEKLEEGKTVDVVVKGRLFRVCCRGCIKKIKADPDKYIKILDDAAAKK